MAYGVTQAREDSGMPRYEVWRDASRGHSCDPGI